MLKRCLLLLLLPFIALAHGCASHGTSKVTIRFWNGFTGPDGRTMLHLVQRFNRENPDVEVLMQRIEWATYYNKLFVAGLGHRAPDVFVLQTHTIKRFAQARFVRPIDDLANGTNALAVADIDANVWQSASVDGKHYGVPLDVWIMGMYYNKKLLRQAGIVDASGQPAPPRTEAEFVRACRAIRAANPNSPDVWGFVFTNFESNVYTIMRQYNGEFFTPDYTRCILNNPQNVAALQWCVNFIRNEKLAPPPENIDAWIGFRQGRVGMVFEGIYMLADLQKQEDLDFAGAPIPQFGPTPAVWAGSHNLCLREGLDAKTLAASWRFVKFLSDNSLDWAAGGQVPVRRSLRATPRFAAMSVQAQFAKQIDRVRYLPQVPFAFEFQTEFDAAVEKALRGSATPQEALAMAQDNINKIIARQQEIARETEGARR